MKPHLARGFCPMPKRHGRKDSGFLTDVPRRAPQRQISDPLGDDFFPTPAWATRALLEVEEFTGTILEPACGDGAMVTELRAAGHEVIARDLFDHGFGERGINFLECRESHPNVVTNPPYNRAETFVHKALAVARRKVAFLLRLAFLEGEGRWKRVYRIHPPARVWVFSGRVTFSRPGVVLKNGSPTAMAWFVWDKSERVTSPEVRWIPAGARRRLEGAQTAMLEGVA
ncbi:MAG: hypothetical protein AAF442_05310 [Pseudomonadota bacterium]